MANGCRDLGGRGRSEARLLVALLIVWIQLVTGQDITIITPPMDIIVSAGDPFNLTCVATGNPPPNTTWERDGLLVGNGDEIGNDLIFETAFPDHAGTYVCVATSGEDSVNASAIVTVIYPPKVLSLMAEPAEEVANGSMVTLNCTVAGFPPPNITWFHNGLEVIESEVVMIGEDGILVLASVRLSDAGVYSCNGTNSLGTAESDIPILLRIYYPPMNIMIHGSPTGLMPQLGDKVTLTCHAASMPEANYTWRREEGGGAEVVVAETDNIMMFDGNGTLLFTMARREDTGNYFCTASNEFGNISSNSVTLYVIAVPPAPVGVVLTILTSYSVSIQWNGITISYPPVATYHVEYKLNFHNSEWMEESVDGITTRQEITSLLPNAKYHVRVRASSPAGRGEPSLQLTFTTDTGVPLMYNTPQDLEVAQSGPRSITVSWTIQPDIEDTSYAFTRIVVTSETGEQLSVEKSGSEKEVTGLDPNTLYHVAVMLSFVGGGLGPAVERQTTTLEDAPDSPPSNLTVSMVTTTAVTVSWSPPLVPNGNITFYTISYHPSDDRDEATTEVVSGDLLLLWIMGLRPFTVYNVSVFANTSEGAGPAETTSFTTLQAAPGAPNITAAFAISSTALMLSWKLEGTIPGVLIGYNVTYRTLGAPMIENFIDLTPDNVSVIVGGLKVWSQYEVCVSAATEGGGPGNDTCVTLRTLPAEPVLELVIENVAGLCPPSLRVTWQPVTSDLLPQLNGPEEDTVYLIVWEEMETGSGGNQSVDFNISNNVFMIDDLMFGTEYSVYVAVSNSNGTGPFSDSVTAMTPPTGGPQVTSLSVVAGPTFLLVSWEPPPPSPEFPFYTYIISLTPPDTHPISTDNTYLNITGLTPATEYMVSVRVDGGCGLGLRVSRSNTTLEAPPGPPTVTIATVSTFSVAMRLEKPVMPNGHITHYMVVCGEEAAVTVSVMDSYHECVGLEPQTPLTVTAWAVNGAGEGERVTLHTSTACQSKVPMVNVMGDEVTVVISDGCPSEAHVLVVVQEVGVGRPRPLASYSVEELMMLTMEYSSQRQRRQLPPSTVYIAANLTRDTSSPFQLGDGDDYGGYTNYPLEMDMEYRVGVVGVSGDLSTPAVFTSTMTFRAPTPTDPTADPTQEEEEFPLVTVAAGGGGLVVLLVVIVFIIMTSLVCCRRRRRGSFNPDMQGKGSSHSFERNTSVRISGRRGNKPTDPVEEYRANYHTEALEAHAPVPIDGFINKLLVMRTNDNQLFLEEFGSIEMAPQQPCSVAELPANRTKNRYHNILPYDHSRVKLSHSKGQNDYINASYCSGYMKVQGFIATQGPLPDTSPDFWRLVWEQNAHTIVMLTNCQERERTKCETYWPREIGCSVVYGGVEVTLTDFTQLADYTVRSLTINKAGSGKDVREVHQFHFTSWPDHGVPQYATAMLAMVRRVQAFHTAESGPMVVHCSAGVGRTGTFIVIYSMLERMKANKKTVDIYGHVSLLRTQRNYMVQTEDQYFFIYEAVAEWIVCGDTEVSLEQLEDYVTDIRSLANEHTDNTNIELQFKRLAVDKSDAYHFASANKDVNKAKNRYVNVLPYENSRVKLQYQRAQEGSDYINASFIDGYHYRHAFIATQGPLLNTMADFWRMVWEHNVPVVVMLTKCHEKGMERSTQYWPEEIGHTLTCGVYSVEMTVERKSEHYTYRDLVLVDTQSGRKRQVRHFHFLSWPEVGVPSSTLVLLDFLREIQKNFATLNTKSPITVHCSNGIGRSGIFIALHIMLERMVAEGLVDVFQTIKNLRIQRPAMVQTLEQYQFCYTAALDYLETSDLMNQLKSSTRSDTHLMRGASNASELRSSRRSLNRNDSLRSSVKRSSRNLEMGNVGNGVSTTVYGVSEATSTFGTTQHPPVTPRPSQDSTSQRPPQGAVDMGDGSGTPVPPRHHPTASPPRLLVNPHLAHLDQPSPLSQGASAGPSSMPQLAAASESYHSLSQGASPSPHPVLQTNTLPSRGGTSGLMQTHWATPGASSSQSSLSHSATAVYPVTSFRGRTSGTSQDSLEQQIASLAMNINNSNNNFVDVYIEP